jgi:hypothetical protein
MIYVLIPITLIFFFQYILTKRDLDYTNETLKIFEIRHQHMARKYNTLIEEYKEYKENHEKEQQI